METGARKQPRPYSGTRVSTSERVHDVGRETKGKKLRSGPPGVQWNETRDRQYARMYSISNAHIEDFSIFMRGGGLEFKKRIAQGKAALNLGPQPYKLRPDAKDPEQMNERIEQAYIMKKYLKDQRHANRHKQLAVVHMSDTDIEKLERDYAEEIENSSQRLSTVNRASYQFLDDFENFAQDPAILARVQSLRKHLLAEQSPRQYSDETLKKYVYLDKRLSLSSVPSHSSRTGSSLSKRNSSASDFSSATGSTILGSTRRSGPATPTRARSENMLLVESVQMDEGHTPYEIVQGFPHVGEFLPGPSHPENNPSLPMCCLHQCRGDPRVVKCLYCSYEIPESHKFVQSLIEEARNGEDVIYKYGRSQLPVNLDEVDGFGDTVLHLAASLGAGSMILDWFIFMKVDVHARNAAGQTFMHVLNPASLAGYCNRYAERAEGVVLLLNYLRSQNFDYNARDDFGQTPLHSLTRYWLNVRLIKLVFDKCFTAGSTLLKRDFEGRSVEERIKAQASVDYNGNPDQQREREINAFLQTFRDKCERESDVPKQQSYYEKRPLPSAPTSVLKEELDNLKQRHLRAMRETITKASSGFPGVEYLGRNGLHCLAESCISTIEAQDSNALPKRKRQEDNNQQESKGLRHDYIVFHVKKLLLAGVNPSDYDIHGNTPLMAFIRNDLSPNPERQTTAEVLRLLIDAGANVHCRNSKGETALHLAMRLGRPSAVDVLLSNHANVYARNRRGEGVREVASKWACRAKRDGARYHRIITCIPIAVRYGALPGPSREDEWEEQKRCIAAA